MLRLPIITILIFGLVSTGIAQDSVKKAAPVKPRPTPTYKYHTVPAVPAVVNPAVKPNPYIKRDTAAPAQAVLTDKSIYGRYQYLLTKVYHYQQPLIGDFWKSVSDTLSLNKHKLNAATANLAVEKKTVDSLNAQLADKDKSLNTSNAHVDAIDLFGLMIPKSVYNLVMWGLVLVFGITAFVILARSGSYSREAKYRIKLYNELEEEFKAYKLKANDKEKKLARELQTERNKLDELLGRG